MTTDHKALYEAAVVLVQAKRCATCEHYNATKDESGCSAYQADIPAEYIYQPNECEKWLVKIPF